MPSQSCDVLLSALGIPQKREREREREREGDRETERQRERDGDRDRETERDPSHPIRQENRHIRACDTRSPYSDAQPLRNRSLSAVTTRAGLDQGTELCGRCIEVNAPAELEDRATEDALGTPHPVGRRICSGQGLRGGWAVLSK